MHPGWAHVNDPSTVFQKVVSKCSAAWVTWRVDCLMGSVVTVAIGD